MLVCEGVGGLLVPLTPGYLVRDLALDLGLPVVVAARTGLGTINHTLLTVEAARAAGLSVAGVVMTPWPAAAGADRALEHRDGRPARGRAGERPAAHHAGAAGRGGRRAAAGGLAGGASLSSLDERRGIRAGRIRPTTRPELLRKLQERKVRHKERHPVHRAGVVVLGALIVLAGIVMSGPGVPGPGIAVIIVGLTFLALEFDRAERLLERVILWGERAAARAEATTPRQRALVGPRDRARARRLRRRGGALGHPAGAGALGGRAFSGTRLGCDDGLPLALLLAQLHAPDLAR